MVIGVVKTNQGRAAVDTGSHAYMANGAIPGRIDDGSNFVPDDKRLALPTEPSTWKNLESGLTTLGIAPAFRSAATF
jgi:hypothetical protein